MAQNQPLRHLVSLDQAAGHLGVSQKTIRRMMAGGRITGYRIGPRLIRVDLNELDALASPISAGGGQVA